MINVIKIEPDRSTCNTVNFRSQKEFIFPIHLERNGPENPENDV